MNWNNIDLTFPNMFMVYFFSSWVPECVFLGGSFLFVFFLKNQRFHSCFDSLNSAANPTRVKKHNEFGRLAKKVEIDSCWLINTTEATEEATTQTWATTERV